MQCSASLRKKPLGQLPFWSGLHLSCSGWNKQLSSGPDDGGGHGIPSPTGGHGVGIGSSVGVGVGGFSGFRLDSSFVGLLLPPGPLLLPPPLSSPLPPEDPYFFA